MSLSKLIRNKVITSAVVPGILTFLTIGRKLKQRVKRSDSCIVVLCFHKLGDSVFTLPALRALRDNLDKDFYIFCFEETKPIYELYFKSEYITGFAHSDIHFNNRIAGKRIKQKLSLLNPSCIYDFTGSITTASLLLFSGSGEVVGINEDYYKSLYTLFVPLRKEPHILDIYLDVVRKAFPGKEYETYKEFPVNLNPGGYVLIHPFAGWPAKEWGMEKFFEISKLLAKNYNVVFVSQPGLIRHEEISELNQYGVETIETGTVEELINAIKKCSLMFSNDSGPAYIANALGRPTFTIFGPTNPDYHVPYGGYNRHIQKNISCSPVNSKYCFTDAGRDGCKSFECMIRLSVEEVHGSIIAFINDLFINKKELSR